MTLPQLQSFPTSYHITHGALGLVTKPSIIWFYSHFPRFPFVNSIFLKTIALHQCLMIHIFHTMLLLNAKPPTSFGARLDHNQSQLNRKHQLCWSYGERAQRHQLKGVSTLSAFCVIYSSSLDSTTHLGLHEICYSSFPNQTSCYVTSDDTLAILQHLAQQVLTNTGLMLELFFCQHTCRFLQSCLGKRQGYTCMKRRSIICPRINNNPFQPISDLILYKEKCNMYSNLNIHKLPSISPNNSA